MHAKKTRTAIVTAVAAAVAVMPVGATASAQEAPAATGQDTITPEERAASAGLLGKIIVVNPGDTLSRLATEHGVAQGWRRLYDANPQVANPNVIVPGMLLRIPEPQEVFAVRPLPSPAVVTTTPIPRGSERADRSSRSAPPATASTSTGVWDQLAQCESGGNWSINTGNGYYGGLQFSLGSWRAVGGSGMPNEASRETQIAMGERLLAVQGWGAWPACSRKLGLR